VVVAREGGAVAADLDDYGGDLAPASSMSSSRRQKRSDTAV